MRRPNILRPCARSSGERHPRSSWCRLLRLSSGEFPLTGAGASLPKVTSGDARLRRRYAPPSKAGSAGLAYIQLTKVNSTKRQDPTKPLFVGVLAFHFFRWLWDAHGFGYSYKTFLLTKRIIAIKLDRSQMYGHVKLFFIAQIDSFNYLIIGLSSI